MKGFKVLAIIFGILSVLTAVLPVVRDNKLLGDIADLRKEAKADAVEETLKDVAPDLVSNVMKEAGVPDTKRVYTAIALAVMLGIASLAGLIMTFGNKPAVKTTGLFMILLATASVMVHPYMERTLTGPASPNEIAAFPAVLATIAGVCMFLFGRKLKTAGH